MENELLVNIKARHAELEELLQEMDSHWGYEDPIYRFYHHSFKVYMLQDKTRKIVDALKELAPKGRLFCREFEEIIKAGAGGKHFEPMKASITMIFDFLKILMYLIPIALKFNA